MTLRIHLSDTFCIVLFPRISPCPEPAESIKHKFAFPSRWSPTSPSTLVSSTPRNFPPIPDCKLHGLVTTPSNSISSFGTKSRLALHHLSSTRRKTYG
ncbi:hypothetical protein TNCV_1666751 [Trichonephila clavipes]|nr:hypothetical protein TNCV_1666751 [Trichonephila clavipes]